MVRGSIESKGKLLESALHVIRAKGYAATTVDDICARAGLTKGSFFHHFKSKDELALAAVDHFNAMAGAIFGHAPYLGLEDPLARLLGYVDFRTAMLDRELTEYTCLLGTLVQETYESHPAIRAACNRGMTDHVEMLMRDVALAKARHAPDATWTADSVGYFIQAALQGAFIFAKVKQGPEVARDCLAHLRRYLELLFAPSSQH